MFYNFRVRNSFITIPHHIIAVILAIAEQANCIDQTPNKLYLIQGVRTVAKAKCGLYEAKAIVEMVIKDFKLDEAFNVIAPCKALPDSEYLGAQDEASGPMELCSIEIHSQEDLDALSQTLGDLLESLRTKRGL